MDQPLPEAADGARATGVLLIAHAPLASAFARAAQDMGLPMNRLAVLDVEPDVLRRHAVASAKMLMADRGCENWLILVDLGGACSPCVIAREVQRDIAPGAKVLTGLNFAMLAAALCNQTRSLDALCAHAAARAAQQIIAGMPASEEDIAFEIAEDNRLRAIGIDPNADPIDIMTELERRYQQYQSEEDDGDDEAGQ